MNTHPIPEEAPDHRTARHLHMCRELAELAMGMARHAAQAAATEWATPDPEPEPAPTPQPTRNSTVHTEPAERPTRTQTAYCAPPSPSLAFDRLSRCVRQIIALENRILADHAVQAERAATRAADRAYCATARPSTPSITPAQPEAPCRAVPAAPESTIPSLLANISREIGVDLTDPTLAQRLPTFLHAAPTG